MNDHPPESQTTVLDGEANSPTAEEAPQTADPRTSATHPSIPDPIAATGPASDATPLPQATQTTQEAPVMPENLIATEGATATTEGATATTEGATTAAEGATTATQGATTALSDAKAKVQTGNVVQKVLQLHSAYKCCSIRH